MPQAASDRKYPPGPNVWSRFRGTGPFRFNSHEFMVRNARQFGDFVHYRVLGRHVFQFNHPDMVQEVLIRDAALHRRGIVMQRARFILGEGMLTSEESLHLARRRMAQPAFQHARMADYGEVIAQVAGETAARWESGTYFDIHRAMLELTLRVAGKCFFDKDFGPQVPEISSAVTAFMGFLPLAFLPFPRLMLRMPIGFSRRIRSSREKLYGMIDAMIAERKHLGTNPAEGRNDFLSLMLAGSSAEGGDREMTDREIRDECVTLLLAGHETTANALGFCFFLMARHPEIQEKVHTEAAEILGSSEPIGNSGQSSASVFERLPYTSRVVAETLRLYPPVWVTARTAAVTYEYRGTTIPAGSLLLVPQIVIHRDPRFFSDPMRFDPDRFLSNAASTRPRYAYFPFGAGPRMCIGESFAWMEAVLVLASVLRDWRLELPAQASPELELNPQISLRPRDGIWLVATRRRKS
jgi:cytochrome P450